MPPDNTIDDCLEKVDLPLKEANCEVLIESVDRAHRIGSVSTQIIVRFKTFSERKIIYKAWRNVKNVKMRLDLTRQRLHQWHKADEDTRNNDHVYLVFVDINCHLAAKFSDGAFFLFLSLEEMIEDDGKPDKI